MLLFFFFFQAEDGIRDGTVTGVQTCALPISMRAGLGQPSRPAPTSARRARARMAGAAPETAGPAPGGQAGPAVAAGASRRSEEHTSELQSQFHLVCRLLLAKKKR